MSNEQASGGVATFKNILIGAGLFYLLLPNLLFLLGWAQPYVAFPLVLLLIGCTAWVYRCPKQTTHNGIARQAFSVGDWVLYGLMLLALLGVTELIGFHGHIQQDPDFNYRNAIYATLVCSDWPVFSARGEYFIYYHAFWLPPALLVKISGGAISPATALFGWSYAGMALMGSLFFLELKKGILIFFTLLFGTISLSFMAELSVVQYFPECKQYFLCGHNHAYLTNFWLNQLRCTFNHAIPCALFLALLLSNGIPTRYMLVPAAFVFGLSPMGAVATIPILCILLYREWRTAKTVPLNLPTLMCCPAVGVILLYLSGQQNQDNAALLFLWNESPFWVQKSAEFANTGLRLVHGLVLCLSIIIPLCLLLDKELRRSWIFGGLILTTIFISLVWIGRTNNELMFKGSLILAFLQAWLLTKQWQKGTLLRKTVLILFICISTPFLCRQTIPLLSGYSWKTSNIQHNLNNRWGWHLNHPTEATYMNFFGTNRMPCILFPEAGQSQTVIRLPQGQRSFFNVEQKAL